MSNPDYTPVLSYGDRQSPTIAELKRARALGRRITADEEGRLISWENGEADDAEWRKEREAR